MKKLFISLFLFIGISASAQLSLLPTGQLVLGTPGIYVADTKSKSATPLTEGLEIVNLLHPVCIPTEMQDSTLQQGLTRIVVPVESVAKALPGIILEDCHGTVSVDYMSLVSVLITSVNQLNAKVAALEAELGIKEEGPRKVQRAGIDEIAMNACTLSQNKPNPCNGETRIDYYLAEGVTAAKIVVCDLQGKILISQSVSAAHGANTETLNVSSLSPGIYIYALVVDGCEVDSKRMITE